MLENAKEHDGEMSITLCPLSVILALILICTIKEVQYALSKVLYLYNNPMPLTASKK